MVKMSLLIANSEIGFQSFGLVTRRWKKNPDQDALQISIHLLEEN